MEGPAAGRAPAPALTDARRPPLATFDAPRVCLLVAIGLWSATFARLGALRHDRFGTFGFDLGIYDQATWLLSRGRDPFVTVRGMESFGHHINAILFVLAPFYRFGAGPHFLLLVQIAAQVVGACAVFLLARDRLDDRWLALALGVAYLLHPTSQWLVWEFFHPDAVAIGPLLFAYWASRERRWGWFAFAAIVAAMCKEDVALVLLVIGLLIAFRGERRIGLGVSAISLGWYVIATRAIIPWQNGIGPFYDSFFGTLGSTPTGVAYNVVRHPGATWELINQRDRFEYAWHMFAPLAFVPLLSPSTLAIALPMLGVNFLTSFPYARDAHFHYSALVLVGLTLATVEGVARMRTIRARRALVGLVLASSFFTTIAWGPSPISREYRDGWWPLQSDPNQAANEAAIRAVPPDAAVSASYIYVPHLAHRERVYEFPVPWRNINWGVRGENLHDPAEVDWIVVNRQLLDDDGRNLLGGLLQSEFQLRSERNGIVVAERVRPPE